MCLQSGLVPNNGKIVCVSRALRGGSGKEEPLPKSTGIDLSVCIAFDSAKLEKTLVFTRL